MIRAAHSGDVPRLLDLMAEMHKRSVYGAMGKIDETIARAALARSIARHGEKGFGGGVLFVSVPGIVVEGLILGVINRVYHVTNLLTIMDGVWFHTGDGGEGLALGDALIDWALTVEGLVEIKLCPNDAIADHTRLEPWLQRKSFTRHGAIWRRAL